MKRSSLPLIILLVLSSVILIVWYKGHLDALDRTNVDFIISHDLKFKDVYLAPCEDGLLLDGAVASDKDRELLLKEINNIKHGRVVSRVIIRPAEMNTVTNR
jgi:hypothetical protein